MFTIVGAVLVLVGVVAQLYLLRARKGPPPRPDRYFRVSQLRRRVRAAAEPSLSLIATDEASFSKLGGDPELPPGRDWPMGTRGLRAFVAQVDLAVIHLNGGPDWLPESGWIYAFYDPERHGFGDVVSVVHSSEPPGPAVTADVKLRFSERRVGFEPLMSVPSLEWMGIDVREVEGDLDELLQLADGDAGRERHRIGGYPNEIQEERMPLTCEHLARGLEPPAPGEEIPRAIERAATDWRLLLQVDSDSEIGMDFGDCGRLYVFIRRSDARRGDLTRTVALWQTY